MSMKQWPPPEHKISNAAPWQPNVVVDRELITAQQPFSDKAFAAAFIAKLSGGAR
jgi:putative intracellular protease/amidase